MDNDGVGKADGLDHLRRTRRARRPRRAVCTGKHFSKIATGHALLRCPKFLARCSLRRISTAATRSAPCFRHRRRSHRSLAMTEVLKSAVIAKGVYALWRSQGSWYRYAVPAERINPFPTGSVDGAFKIIVPHLWGIDNGKLLGDNRCRTKQCLSSRNQCAHWLWRSVTEGLIRIATSDFWKKSSSQ